MNEVQFNGVRLSVQDLEGDEVAYAVGIVNAMAACRTLIEVDGSYDQLLIVNGVDRIATATATETGTVFHY